MSEIEFRILIFPVRLHQKHSAPLIIVPPLPNEVIIVYFFHILLFLFDLWNVFSELFNKLRGLFFINSNNFINLFYFRIVLFHLFEFIIPEICIFLLHLSHHSLVVFLYIVVINGLKLFVFILQSRMNAHCLTIIYISTSSKNSTILFLKNISKSFLL